MMSDQDHLGAVAQPQAEDNKDMESLTTRIEDLFKEISAISDESVKENVTSLLVGKVMEVGADHPSSILPQPSEEQSCRKKELKIKTRKISSDTSSEETSASMGKPFKPTKSKSGGRRASKYRLVYSRSLKPIPFNVNEVKTLDDFLSEFEDYAAEYCGSDQRKWLLELGTLLEGAAKASFTAINTGKISYEGVINKLRKWYKERSKGRREDGHMAFSQAKFKDGDSPYLFALRLESLIEGVKLANLTEREEFLLQKFMHEVPKSLRKKINERINYMEFIGKARGKTNWDIVREMLAEDESSDENATYSWTRRASVPPPIDIFAQQHMKSSEQRRMSYSDTLKEGGFNVMSPQTLMCRYCKKTGHEENSCRRKLRLCFICGSNKHMMQRCQDYKGKLQSKERNCHICGSKDHFYKNCPRFQERGMHPTETTQFVTREYLNTWSDEIVDRVINQVQNVGMQPLQGERPFQRGNLGQPIENTGTRPKQFNKLQSTAEMNSGLNLQAPSFEGGAWSN